MNLIRTQLLLNLSLKISQYNFFNRKLKLGNNDNQNYVYTLKHYR